MSVLHLDPQVRAADPDASAFVTANAGSGKTKTLVDRVARLLLRGARAEAILCVTYTKAAAAEMQRRLFDQLGGWSMLDDAALGARLAAIGENPRDLSRARTLFARALEAPGGLKIETLHAFCEKLLRRFPLEAGVSPGFEVLDDAAAADIAARARDRVARAAMAGTPGLAQAYAEMAVALDFASFEQMFLDFQVRRETIGAHLRGIGGVDALPRVAAHAAGLDAPVPADALEAAAMSPPAFDPELWRAGAVALTDGGGKQDGERALKMAAVAEGLAPFEDAVSIFCTGKGEPAKWLETSAVLKREPLLHMRLLAERDRLLAIAAMAKAARVAEGTVHALTLAAHYIAAFDALKTERGVLDFADLISRARALLNDREDAAWVLYKLDGGIDHVLVDEAQDTAPEQWEILSALTAEFFAGSGVRGEGAVRTVFVVGDEKQSIYSFQGAIPERLAEEAVRYADAASGVEHPFAQVPLQVSYRSTPEVLAFVDAVFEPQTLRAALQPRPEGLDGADELIRHIAHRSADAGTIDLWPLEREEPSEERRAWDEPLDVGARRGAHRRLAERIADEIKAIVARGDRVGSGDKARPAVWGDVLILVRKRKALFQELLRALKHKGVPVAGADRLVLSEHPVFEDLLALTRFVLFPFDDLTLAAVLRSPLCDLDEDSLFALAHGRSGALWFELQHRAGERVEWGTAHDLLAWAMETAARVSPFAFYGRLLSRLDANGMSMRQRFATRLGPEAGDALDEILAQALAAEQRGVRDLERFADAVGRLHLTVKREMDAPAEGGAMGEVRILTAHSSKGLEAPIVFLPETVGAGAPRGSPLLETGDGGFLWCASKGADCEASGQVRALREARAAREDMRLLYVALTRARDRLVIAGRINALAKLETVKGWWAPMRDAFDHPDLTGRVRDLSREDGEIIRRFGPDPVPAPARPSTLIEHQAPPMWLWRFAPGERETGGLAAPSGAEQSYHGPAPSPLSTRFGLGRFRRGELIHRLLQVLPDLPPHLWESGAARLLEKEPGLDAEQRREMAEAALGVLNDARFAEVFGPGSRAEAAVAGTASSLPAGMTISGRVDRMTVSADRVLVVDFKTNRPSPDVIEDADPAYLTQMALYVAVLGAVFPERRVEAALVWTDGPKLMPVPDELMTAALARLHAQA